MNAALTKAERKAAIIKNMQQLTAKLPTDLAAWPAQKAQDFNFYTRAFSTYARPKGSFKQLLACVARIADFYGVSMVRIDPCHGEAA